MGLPFEVVEEIKRLFFKFQVAENTKGGNDEARLCLKLGAGTEWGACEDYAVYVSDLGKVWEERVKREGGRAKLGVWIVFPEEDIMIGRKGMKVFEGFWTEERCGAGVDVHVETVLGADHDSTVMVTEGVMGKMYERVKAHP